MKRKEPGFRPNAPLSDRLSRAAERVSSADGDSGGAQGADTALEETNGPLLPKKSLL